MSEHKRKQAKSEAAVQPESKHIANANDEEARVIAERYRNANPGFFLRAATWLLSRFALTKHRYQNWSPTKRIVIGWLLWLILLPIIPIAVLIIWYFNDPEGFKKSPWSKLIIGLAVVWAGYFGLVAVNPSQADVNGRYSPIQTAPNGETVGKADKVNTPSAEAKQKVANQKDSKASNGRKFENCTEAFDAGVFNIRRSDASYQPKLDRDKDGIACEK